MAVPYSDVAKGVNDLFNKDFPFAITKLEVKSVASNGVAFTLNGSQNPKSGAISSELKTQFNDYHNGLNTTLTFNDASALGFKVELADKVLNGLKLELNNTFIPATNGLTTKVTVSHKSPTTHSRILADLLNGPIFNADTIALHKGFILGGEAGYNLKTGNVTKYNGTVGYATPEFSLTLQSNKSLNEFTTGFLHRIAINTEVGARVHYITNSEKPVSIEVGAKHIIDKYTALKAKVDSVGQVGLSLTQVLRPGVKATLGASIDSTRLNQDAHKFGFHLVLN
ncbi:Mitochondrial porin [Entomophthora muscae]|uniref:Mitochondrial porin n=1 Tax=Entomophthora muscae TaxID=34485 RepID=A0ACC2UCL3_9FUNG|nr:Mitochondrial porin [Entomophthora muscae]